MKCPPDSVPTFNLPVLPIGVTSAIDLVRELALVVAVAMELMSAARVQEETNRIGMNVTDISYECISKKVVHTQSQAPASTDMHIDRRCSPL